MAGEHKIVILNDVGNRVAEITDYLYLAYTKQVNTPGIAQFQLLGINLNISEILPYRQVLIYRKDTDVDWYIDFVGYVVKEQWTTQDVKDVVTYTVHDILNVLSWRVNAYYANTANKTSFTSVATEDIMKTLITGNFTSSATTGNGRLRNAQSTGLTITNGLGSSRGNTLTWNNAYANVLTDLQKLALVGGGDFALNKTGQTGIAFTFQFYPGQLGTNRTADITFSVENGNMTDPVYTVDRTGLKTVAIVAGKGEANLRETAIRTGSVYAAGILDFETFVDARNTEGANGLNAAGDTALEKADQKVELSFKVLQTPSYRYGIDYFLGDLVVTKYRDFNSVQKINRVTVKVDRARLETIDIEMR